ncbi:hypothetical protein AB2L27_10450 [Kineococcus sp. LSe6-4]|uniref:Uncharacterized protein n=1 Tax=Kineococcus halophytocola TaxID=3234027 RepID=A0ABV4H0U4_9ACTN
MAGAVLAAVTAQVPDVDPDATRDWDAEFWSLVAGFDVPTGTVTRRHDDEDGDGVRFVRPHHRTPPGRWPEVVRRPAGRERSPPHPCGPAGPADGAGTGPAPGRAGRRCAGRPPRCPGP